VDVPGSEEALEARVPVRLVRKRIRLRVRVVVAETGRLLPAVHGDPDEVRRGEGADRSGGGELGRPPLDPFGRVLEIDRGQVARRIGDVDLGPDGVVTRESGRGQGDPRALGPLRADRGDRTDLRAGTCADGHRLARREAGDAADLDVRVAGRGRRG